MRKPTPPEFRGRPPPLGKRTMRAPNGSAGVMADGMCERGVVCNTGSPLGWLAGGAGQRWCREARNRPLGVADRVVVPVKPGNAGGGKDPWSGNGAGRSERQAIDALRLATPKSRGASQGTTCESEGGSRGCIGKLAVALDLTALGAVIGPASGCAGSTRWAARGFTASPTSAQHVVAPRAPVRASARPSVGEGMILERAGCGKSARPVRRAATGNGVGINRIMPARHRASRRLY